MKSTLQLLRTRFVLAVAAPVLFATLPVFGQAKPETGNISVHGHITNAAGIAESKGDVKLSSDQTSDPKDRKWQYDFPVDAQGNYKGTGIVPNSYIAVFFVGDKSVDFQNVVLKSGDDRAIDFDMTRADYLKAMSPEDRKALDEYKKKNASVVSDNAKIANINETLQKARADEKNGHAADAVQALTPLTTQKPDEALIWASLGEAQLAQADDAAKAAKAAHTAPNDPATTKIYADAATSYQKAIDLNTASKKPNPQLASASYINLGQAYAKSGDPVKAAAAYEGAVKAAPESAGSAYFNEAAVFYNAGKLDEAGAAADKSIAADPKRADAYYIKGQSLIPKATVDAKTQKIVAPPGCVEAYQAYLELAPDGPHAADVKGILGGIGAPIQNKFKAGRKH